MGGFSTVTSQGASPTAVAQTVWSYSPRSLTDIQNLASAIQNNNPGALSEYSEFIYLPAPYYSGQVSLTQVAIFIDNAVRNYNLAGAFDGFISNNPYNLWNTNFVANLAINSYLTATSLNMLITNEAISPNSAQLLLYQLAQNYYYNKWIQTITAGYGSTTISTNVTITTSPIFAQNLTISTGVTVTCGLQTCYFITQQFNNYGTIVNQNGGVGGIGGAKVGGYGGTGGGGIVVLALTSALGTINVNGNAGLENTGWSNGYGSGGVGGTGTLLSLTTVPSGGVGGSTASTNYNVGGGGGGPNGTGGDGYDAGGGGGPVTLYTFSNGNSMLTFIMQGISDWWQINVLGKSPSSTTPLYNIYNAGGGGGGYYDSNGGGGGGGGGEVIVYAYILANGSISANGGNGGIGFSTSYATGGGGGGAGGVIYVFYGSTSGSLTFSVAGGTGGVGSTSNTNGAAGSTGIATTIQLTVNG